MSKRLDKISFKEIIKKVGVPTEVEKIFDAINEMEDENVYQEVMEILKKPNGIDELLKQESKFDKAKYILITGIDREEFLKRSKMTLNNKLVSEAIIIEYERTLNEAKKLLKDEDVAIVESVIQDGRIDVKTFSSLDFNGRSDKRKAKVEEKRNRLNKIKQENPELYEEMVKNIRPVDFVNLIMDNFSVGFRMPNFIYGNILLEKGEITEQEIRTKGSRITTLAKKIDDEEIAKFVGNTLYKYAEYINIDKMILTTIARKYLSPKTEGRDIEKMNEIKSYINGMLKYIENPRVSIQGDTEGLISERYEVAKISSPIRLKDIRNSMQNYVNGIDYTPENVEKITIKLLAGELDINDFSKEELEIIARNKNKKLLLMEEEEFAVVFLKNGLLNQGDMQDIKKSKLSNEIFSTLYENEYIEQTEILNKYLKDEIQIEGILQFKEELKDLVSEKSIVQAFIKRDEEKEKYKKLKNLYNELKIKNKTNEERTKLGELIISENDRLLDEKELMELYSERLITVDNAIDWGGEDIAIKLFKNGELSSSDARRLYESNIIKIETFKEILKDKNMKLVKKFALVNMTFSGKEYEKIRIDLIRDIKVEEKELRSRNKKGRESKNPKVENIKKDLSERITDPSARWNFIRILDSDYTEEITSDGYLIDKMPNEGKYMIEPLYKSDDNITDYAKNAASFFVDIKKFEEMESQIINEKNKVNVGLLNEMTSEGMAVRITHTTRKQTWAKKVMRYILDTTERTREKDEIEIIEEAAKEVDRSCRTIEREI